MLGAVVFFAKKLLSPNQGGRIQHAVAIYGAGEAGIVLATSMRRDGRQSVIRCIDEDLTLRDRDVAGVKVFPVSSLPKLSDRFGVRRELFALLSDVRSSVRQHSRQDAVLR